MGKYIFFGFVLLVIVVSFISVYRELGGQIKTTSLWKSFFWEMPSYQSGNRPSIKIGENKNFTFGVSGSQQGISKQDNYLENDLTTRRKSITPPAGFSIDDLSPYYEMVKISYINPGFYSMGRVDIRASYNLSQPVYITGWRLKSNKGEMIIPQGVSDYLPTDSANTQGDIYLDKGGEVNMFNWVSANGKNLRLNKCIGYLNGVYKFSPTLPCNYAKMYEREEISGFSGECQNYILSLYSCKTPTPQDLNYFSKEPQCRYFLDRFSYEGCYKLHRNSSDFFGKVWYVWIPGFWNFDKDHDKVLLLDKNGLLVDIYTY